MSTTPRIFLYGLDAHAIQDGCCACTFATQITAGPSGESEMRASHPKNLTNFLAAVYKLGENNILIYPGS